MRSSGFFRLDEARPDEAGAHEETVAGAQVLRAPWENGRGQADVILVADTRGVVAALAYQPSDEVPLPAVDLAVGRHAVAVRRGVARVAPGMVLPSPAPIALLVRREEGAERARTYFVAVGAPGARQVGDAALERLAAADLLDRAVAEAAGDDGPLLAVWTTSGR